MNKTFKENDIVHIFKAEKGEKSKLKRKDAKLYAILYFLLSFLFFISCAALIIFIIPSLICLFMGYQYYKLSEAPAINTDNGKQQTNYNSNVNNKYAHGVDTLKMSKTTVNDIHEEERQIEKTYEFKVVGVTFKTGRESRQAALRKIHFHDEPFEKIHVKLEKYDFEGETAIGVFVNDFQVGNIARNEIDNVLELISDNYSIDYSVYGGREKNWGMVIKISKKI